MTEKVQWTVLHVTQPRGPVCRGFDLVVGLQFDRRAPIVFAAEYQVRLWIVGDSIPLASAHGPWTEVRVTADRQRGLGVVPTGHRAVIDELAGSEIQPI